MVALFAAARGGLVAGVIQDLVAGGLGFGLPGELVVVVESGLSLIVVSVVLLDRAFCFCRRRRYRRLMRWRLVSCMGVGQMVSVVLSMEVVGGVDMEVLIGVEVEVGLVVLEVDMVGVDLRLLMVVLVVGVEVVREVGVEVVGGVEVEVGLVALEVDLVGVEMELVVVEVVVVVVV